MIRRLLAEVAAPKSSRSTSATRRPRSAASHAMQAPWMPPPMTSRSWSSPSSRLRSRRIGPAAAAGPASGPLADPIGPAVGRAQVHDDLADQTESQQLHPQRQEQDREEEQRPVRDALALKPVHQQDQRRDRAGG